MTTAELNANDVFSFKGYVWAGYLTMLLTFGGFGGWAAIAPLASGVVAEGRVSVETNRKSVQHLEGGIVQDIMVTEGDMVEAGQPLIVLDDTQAQANFAVQQARLSTLELTEARLVAESTGAETITMPASVEVEPPADVQGRIDAQQTLFEDRRATRDGQIDILRTRLEQFSAQTQGLEVQLEAIEAKRTSLGDETARLTSGQQQGLVATNQLSQALREQLDLQANYGQVLAEIARTGQERAEVELQIVQIGQEFKERASEELREIRNQLSETTERTLLARDTLERTVIRAPVRGVVQEIRVHSTQAVIRAAETLLEIIPVDDDLIVNARIRPLDIDSVSIGSQAEVRFSAFPTRNARAIFGTVEVVSSDVVEPQDGTSEPYYLARVRADEDIPAEIRERLLPGMPASVVISTGERTLLQYLTKPITDSFATGLREQ